MLFLFNIAWRNIFRNIRRTVLASLAIGIGLAALIFTDAMMVGMIESMTRTATDTFLGQGQIHAEGFRSTREVEKTVNNLSRLLERLRGEQAVKRFSLRTQTFGMIASPANAGSVLLYGIDPRLEKEVSKLDEALVKGAYLSAGGLRKMLIGEKLAETLEVAPGDRVVVTVAEAETGELVQEMFRIGGVFRFNVREMDSGMGFMHLKTSQALLGLADGVHEVVLQFDDLRLSGDTESGFWLRYSQDGNQALGWKALMPQLDKVVQMSQYSSSIMAVILFSVVSLGIMNTLFMSLYERMFEFGVLRAVGTRPFRMALMVLFEAGALSILSILVGSAIGFGVTYAVSLSGIDYVGIEFAEMTIRELIYPVLQAEQFVVFPLVVFLFTLIAGIYPAVFAARLTPAEAMKAHD